MVLLLEVTWVGGWREEGAETVSGVIGLFPGLDEGSTGISSSSNCGVNPTVLVGWASPRISDRTWEDSFSSSLNRVRFS